jgi:two-component system, LytTR family, response regulator
VSREIVNTKLNDPRGASTGRGWKALIVDDEELARTIVREMLSTHPEIEVVAECGNGMAAVKAAVEFAPDLMFLDVQMPKLTGFDVLELVDASKAAVIFVTAYDQYAMKAFEVHALDYLLKPFSRERFESALKRAKCQRPEERAEAATLAASARPVGQYLERIVVKDGTKVTLIPVAKLDYAEALDDYVSLVSEGKKQLKQQTISGLEMALDPARFVRIHRSYLVNLERVARIEPYAKDSKVAILANGVKLPVSRAGLGRLKKLLDGKE